MDASATPFEFRRRARHLLRQLRAGDATAAARFVRLRAFGGATVEELLERRDDVRLKHALAVIALEQGAPSWPALKAGAERFPPMYETGTAVLLNRWFARYEEAASSRRERGGYLLPYRQQFFVCEAEGIRTLGLDPDDPDWERIGWDWVAPRDRDAWRRLCDKRTRVLELRDR